jgi:hypothetical protein
MGNSVLSNRNHVDWKTHGRSKNARDFLEIMLGLIRSQMREDRPGFDQRERRTLSREGQCPGSRARVEPEVEDIVVEELEVRRNGREIRLAPRNHSFVKVDSKVAARLGILLD